MAVFVHLFPEDALKRIKTQGINTSHIHYPDADIGVFCMPVVQDFFATHQWARELMRWNKKSVLAVYFRIPDKEEVWYGHYNQGHRKLSACMAVELFSNEKEQLGYQVIVTRKIDRSEIVRIKKIPPLDGAFHLVQKGEFLVYALHV